MGVHVTRDELKKILRLKLEPIESSLNFKDDEHRKLMERVVNLEKTVKTLELENNALKAQLNTTISKVKTNEALLDEQEQYMRRECVEIKGIPVSRDENTNEVVKQVAGLLDVEVGEDDISISHRLPPIRPWTDENGTVHSPPPTIIAKFVKRDVKENFYRARYKLKNKSSRDLGGLSSAEGNKIFISESLTQTRKKLFKAALNVKKELNFDFISTTNGRIFLRQNKDSRSHLITCDSDLAKLKASVRGQGQVQTGGRVQASPLHRPVRQDDQG